MEHMTTFGPFGQSLLSDPASKWNIDLGLGHLKRTTSGTAPHRPTHRCRLRRSTEFARGAMRSRSGRPRTVTSRAMILCLSIERGQDSPDGMQPRPGLVDLLFPSLGLGRRI